MYITHMPRPYQSITLIQSFTDFPSKLSFCLAAENPVFFPDAYSLWKRFEKSLKQCFSNLACIPVTRIARLLSPFLGVSVW